MSSDDDWGSADSDGLDEFAFDGESFGEDDLKKGGGGTVDKEGWYHLEVAEVKPELATINQSGNPVSPAILFVMQVLQTVEGQSPAGAKLFHRIYVGGKEGQPAADGAVKSALKLGVALGLLECIEKDERSVTVIKGTTNAKISARLWEQAKGRQVIGHVKYEKGTEGKDGGKSYKGKYAVPFGDFWAPDDPAMSTVQKNADALASIGVSVAPNTVTPPAKPGAPKAAPQTVPVDDFGDL